jgi:hypothetical protein
MTIGTTCFHKYTTKAELLCIAAERKLNMSNSNEVAAPPAANIIQPVAGKVSTSKGGGLKLTPALLLETGTPNNFAPRPVDQLLCWERAYCGPAVEHQIWALVRSMTGLCAKQRVVRGSDYTEALSAYRKPFIVVRALSLHEKCTTAVISAYDAATSRAEDAHMYLEQVPATPAGLLRLQIRQVCLVLENSTSVRYNPASFCPHRHVTGSEFSTLTTGDLVCVSFNVLCCSRNNPAAMTDRHRPAVTCPVYLQGSCGVRTASSPARKYFDGGHPCVRRSDPSPVALLGSATSAGVESRVMDSFKPALHPVRCELRRLIVFLTVLLNTALMRLLEVTTLMRRSANSALTIVATLKTKPGGLSSFAQQTVLQQSPPRHTRTDVARETMVTSGCL